jgi:hypothetical protein
VKPKATWDTIEPTEGIDRVCNANCVFDSMTGTNEDSEWRRTVKSRLEGVSVYGNYVIVPDKDIGGDHKIYLTLHESRKQIEINYGGLTSGPGVRNIGCLMNYVAKKQRDAGVDDDSLIDVPGLNLTVDTLWAERYTADGSDGKVESTKEKLDALIQILARNVDTAFENLEEKTAEFASLGDAREVRHRKVSLQKEITLLEDKLSELTGIWIKNLRCLISIQIQFEMLLLENSIAPKKNRP